MQIKKFSGTIYAIYSDTGGITLDDSTKLYVINKEDVLRFEEGQMIEGQGELKVSKAGSEYIKVEGRAIKNVTKPSKSLDLKPKISQSDSILIAQALNLATQYVIGNTSGRHYGNDLARIQNYAKQFLKIHVELREQGVEGILNETNN